MSDSETLLERIGDDFGELRVTQLGAYRFLYFGEQTEQSCCLTVDPGWLEYDYTRAMLLGNYWAPAEGGDMLLLGLGGGSLANCLIDHFEPQRVVAVELRPAVIGIARSHLGLTSDPRLKVIAADAQQFVTTTAERFGLICVDLYMEGGLSRLQLQGAFFEGCRKLLKPGGVLVINQWQLAESGQPYASRMLLDLFGDQYLQAPVEEGNIILVVPADGILELDRPAMNGWADALEPQLGYSLRPYIHALRRACDAPAADLS
ncbi:methyltransferase domain-containing protein [Halopseudomonas nanhaiensis]|uniref:spermidine synthase n=1 Tax=Halopseudomonas nanhaiensis TaxID=2830842 RepID=UPI001CBD5BDB|nr:methyltransferase domain-containing protein [Halopseudomonas nanhaiensis]UAW97155.1 methyltransferase domain-containing protein [Halopseudomonas nanhaiensis]